jgi:hypothetical protein
MRPKVSVAGVSQGGVSGCEVSWVDMGVECGRYWMLLWLDLLLVVGPSCWVASWGVSLAWVFEPGAWGPIVPRW